MVDLVLKDAGVPAAGADVALLGALVQAGDADGEPARDEREVTGEAEAALEEFDPPPGSASSRGL
jgi:hypothetical protein